MTRGHGRRNQDKGAFGTVSKLPSGRYRALYYGPDGKRGRRYSAPTTFTTKKAARKWLSLIQADMIRNVWLPPDNKPANADPGAGALTLASYAGRWLEQRDLKDRTREHYRSLLDAHILPTRLARRPIAQITADDVRAWYAALDRSTPTLRAHCYGLLRTIMGTAVTDGKIAANPCVIRGAGSAKRAINIRPASIDELAKLTDAMPPKYQAMVLLGAWCALRFGELTELRRGDIDLEEAVVRVRRGVVRTKAGFAVTSTKSQAGSRDVAIPHALLPALHEHLVDYVEPGRDALLFPADHGGHLAPATLYRHFYKARDAARRPDLRVHDLRHTGATFAAQKGATLAELMGRLGHSTPAAAMRYQHVAQGRDRALAAKLSKLVQGGSEA
jgi:integrase